MSSSTRATEGRSAYTVIIGLEVHVQLATVSKLFCRCSTKFGADPNTQVCPVCLGMPGSLPVMNRRAFELALQTAVALNCQIPSYTKWDRKNYYYPDLPKGYQISQFDLPMSHDGWLEISDAKGRFSTKKVGIIRAHLEEDAGKSLHDEVAGRADTRIDLNRTGTPLLEIVSAPDMRSAAEARAYLNELRLLLTYLGVSDCNMQEGSLRVDANVNLHLETEDGVVATPIVEVKNMNSFRAVERALEYEIQRQYERWLATGERLGSAPKQTRGWDDQAQVTRAQRSKEESSDYRYFPDPDLVPVTVTAEQIALVHSTQVELPSQLRDRLQANYQLPAYDADVLVSQGRPLVNYFERVAECSGDAKRSSNWIQQDVMRTLKEQGIMIEQFPVAAEELGGLLRRISAGTLPSNRAQEVFASLLAGCGDVELALRQLGIEQVNDQALVELCRKLLSENPQVVADVREGKSKAVGALIGQAKKANPNIDPAQFRDTCVKLILEGTGSPPN